MLKTQKLEFENLTGFREIFISRSRRFNINFNNVAGCFHKNLFCFFWF